MAEPMELGVRISVFERRLFADRLAGQGSTAAAEMSLAELVVQWNSINDTARWRFDIDLERNDRNDRQQRQ